MERKATYKHAAESVESIRNRRRHEDNVVRKDKRQQLLNSKRFRRCSAEYPEISSEQVIEATKDLQKKGDNRHRSLQTLRRSFAQGSAFIDVFLGVDNSLQCLVGLLTGSDADLQLEAAWCLTNIAAGTHDHAMAVTKTAAPYLITYLGSSNHLLTDQCAWALGNLAGDSKQIREILQAQGCVLPLVKLIESPTPDVVQCAAFALSNLARESADITREIVKCGVIHPLSLRLKEGTDNHRLVSELAWMLTYLTASGEHTSEIVSQGCLVQVVEYLNKLSHEPRQDAQAMTPLLRTLGNICSGPDENTKLALENPFLLPVFEKFLVSPHRHIIKETLWVLSNMTSDESVCRSVAFGPILAHIIERLSDAYDIKVEAAYLLCNLGCHGADICTELIHKGAMPQIALLLKSPDVEMLHLALSFSEMALRQVEAAKFQFEESDGVARLEGLEYHENEMIRQQAHDLLDTYFNIGGEEDEETVM
ncbi:importin subunit alpha-9-like [Haliotis rufescens]|uniref:importin subunit alpha-9-like n=1 Tax=Haliotis rufescens TaxID=6454 RepID=UPI00201F597C|nr:importin subunit alpha-9-like [Haliotis rufescens]